MKIIQFTIPVAKDHAVIVQEDIVPHFYNHLHRHNETQITWIIKGEGTLVAGNYMQPFKPGDVYILGANQPHIFKSDPVYFDKRRKKQVHAISFFFNPNGFFKPILELNECKSIKKFVDSTAYGVQLPQADQEKITAEMLAVKNAKQGLRLAAFIRMLHIMSGIRGWTKLSTMPAEFTFSDIEGLRMNDVYQFTMTHYAENIKLKQVADIAFMTPQAFCRYFKKRTGKNYIVFLNEIRISEACKKITTGNCSSIASVAYDTGFSSAVSFNRVFKKMVSCSPRQYQKEYLQKIN